MLGKIKSLIVNKLILFIRLTKILSIDVFRKKNNTLKNTLYNAQNYGTIDRKLNFFIDVC